MNITQLKSENIRLMYVMSGYVRRSWELHREVWKGIIRKGKDYIKDYMSIDG